MSKRFMFLVNPNAGKSAYKTELGEVLKIFCDAGWQPNMFFTRGSGQAPALVEKNAGDYDAVVCLGGDGTLSEVASGLMRLSAPPPVGYIPLGTANDVAHTLHLPAKPAEAAQRITNGSPIPYDIGEMGEGNFFTYVAAFGAFTEVSYATPQESKQALGQTAYTLEALRQLPKLTDYHAIVEYDSGVMEGDFVFGAVTNSTSVAGLVKLSEDAVDLADGLFEVLLVRRPRDILDMGDIVGSVLSGDFSGPNVNFLKSREVRIMFDAPVAWTRDGEDGGKHRDVFIRNNHPGIEIIV